MDTSHATTEIDQPDASTDILVRNGLLACIEALESENATLKEKSHYFCIEDIQDDDKMVSFYTGFVSYMVFSTFLDFLRPAVDNLK